MHPAEELSRLHATCCPDAFCGKLRSIQVLPGRNQLLEHNGLAVQAIRHLAKHARFDVFHQVYKLLDAGLRPSKLRRHLLRTHDARYFHGNWSIDA
jgi:hypothetical protein